MQVIRAAQSEVSAVHAYAFSNYKVPFFALGTLDSCRQELS